MIKEFEQRTALKERDEVLANLPVIENEVLETNGENGGEVTISPEAEDAEEVHEIKVKESEVGDLEDLVSLSSSPRKGRKRSKRAFPSHSVSPKKHRSSSNRKEKKKSSESDVWAYPEAEEEVVEKEEEFSVEAIVGHKKLEGGKGYLYRIKWMGYPSSQNSWEPSKVFNAFIQNANVINLVEHLTGCIDLLSEYHSTSLLPPVFSKAKK